MSRFNTNNQLCNHWITFFLLPVCQVFQSKPRWECFPTDLSSFGMRTSLWHVQRQTTPAAGKWKETPRLRRRPCVSLAGGSQVSPPASSRAPTHQTLGCTGVSLSRGGPATRSASQWQVNLICVCTVFTSTDCKLIVRCGSLFQMIFWSWRARYFLWWREIRSPLVVYTRRKTKLRLLQTSARCSTKTMCLSVPSLQERWSSGTCLSLTKAPTSVDTQDMESHFRVCWQSKVTLVLFQ